MRVAAEQQEYGLAAAPLASPVGLAYRTDRSECSAVW